MNSHAPGRNVALTVLAILGVVAALYLAAELLMPIAVAAVFSVALRPLVRGMKRSAGIPAPVGATVVILGVVGLVGVGAWLLDRPVRNWIEQAPGQIAAAREKIESVRRPIQKATDLANQVGLSSSPATSRPTSQRSTPGNEPAPVRHEGPVPPEGAAASGRVADVLGTTRTILSAAVEAFLLLWLLLASDNLFYKKLLKVLPSYRDKEKAARSVDEVESAVLRYLWASFLLSLGEAVCVVIVFWALGMPGPLLWGAACLVLEFIPYLGATVLLLLMTLTAAATMDSVAHVLAVPGSYLLISTLQNNVASPYLYGSHLKLNPVAVLIGVMFWWFVWGVPGAFLAVPIVATAKIVADRTEHWKPLGEFLGE